MGLLSWLPASTTDLLVNAKLDTEESLYDFSHLMDDL